MSGFKNCEEIKAFAVGQRVKYAGGWQTVIYVRADGAAETIAEDDDESRSVLHPPAIPDCEIDLSSVWVGRECNHKATSSKAVVLSVAGDMIGWKWVASFSACWPREQFLAEFTPLPLAEDKPVEPAAEPWKPKNNEIVLWAPGKKVPGDLKAGQVRVICWDEELVGYICHNSNNGIFVAEEKDLRPLPEPPVKEGDVLCVTTGGGEKYYGPVSSVQPEDWHFLILVRSGNAVEHGFDWRDVTIQKLVPESKP